MNMVNKLLMYVGEDTRLIPDKWTIENQYVTGMKKWIANIVPAELLKRTVKQAVDSLVTLSQD